VAAVQWAKKVADCDVGNKTRNYYMGWSAGIDFAIMTLKSMFGLGEYAEGSEK
jgi:hypothetical protein